MNIIAVDDEKDALWHIERSIRAAEPDCTLHTYTSPKQASEFAAANPVDVAFLDVQMRGTTGLELATKLKSINPKTNIILVTAYSDYMGHAFKLRASGYIVKPSTSAAVRSELDNLRFPPETQTGKAYVQCFGSFEVFMDGAPMHFARAKCKELFAYLIDRRGAAVTTGELLGILYEDTPVTDSLKSQFRRLIADLAVTLKECDRPDWLVKSRNSFAVVVDKIPCDLYAFLNGDESARHKYAGEYMAQYPWAEITNAWLYERIGDGGG